MKTQYINNLQRDGQDYQRGGYSNLTPITETHYSEIGRLKQQNFQLQNQLTLQKELIEWAEDAIKYGPNSPIEQRFKEKLNSYKEKYK